MQSLHLGLNFQHLTNPRGLGVYQRVLAPSPPLPVKGGMDVSTLLNSRKRSEGGDELARFRQSLHLDGAAYSMDQGSDMAHHQPSLPQSHVTPYSLMAPPQNSPQMYAASGYMPRHDSQSTISDENLPPTQIKSEPAPKLFPCGTCSKRFARRSDLARHDSSSLARHRRMHAGARPYQCAFANCQKTFTRRTTLTKHQSQHTGTLEQAAAEVNAKLALSHPRSQSIYESTSGGSSRNSTASPANRILSISPHSELPPMTSGMQRQGSDYGFLPQTHSLPPHMRTDFGPNLPRSTPPLTSHSLQQYTSAPQQRPVTSHPPAYGPPQPLEPPANGTSSGSTSPHLGALAWGSPGSGSLPTPASLETYGYPEPAYGGHSLYYPGSAIRRPQSTEPEDYGLRPRQPHMATHISLPTDWTSMPLAVQDNRQERYVM
ncbi:C2H2 finger domain protein [Fonsecaea pedrosoi]|nr:C2H2 finger domain protein [Fonsecaea pedrosoi]